MDKTLYKTLLYDFYGELLSEKQKQIYEMYYLKDFSLMEIAECVGISRQGVRDAILRCEKALENYEKKLSLVSNHLKRKQELAPMILEIDALLLSRADSGGSAEADRDIYKTIERIKKYLTDTLA